MIGPSDPLGERIAKPENKIVAALVGVVLEPVVHALGADGLRGAVEALDLEPGLGPVRHASGNLDPGIRRGVALDALDLLVTEGLRRAGLKHHTAGTIRLQNDAVLAVKPAHDLTAVREHLAI